MVFRKVPAGTYQIGHAKAAQLTTTNNVHNTTIGKDYYIGIFTVTASQHSRIMGVVPTVEVMTPTNAVSWNELRGSAGVAATPTTGLIANLNSKTGLVFDLPTESMWEVAARAGVTTYYLWGDDASDGYEEWAWLSQSGLNNVGLKKANAIGLYDVLGNARESCRDAWNSAPLGSIQANGLAPITTATTSGRIITRGGGYNSKPTDANQIASLSYRSWSTANSVAAYTSYRLSLITTD